MATKKKTFKLEHKNGIYTCELTGTTRSKSIHIRVEPTDDERHFVGPDGNNTGEFVDASQESLFPEYKPGRAYIVRVTYPYHLSRKTIIETVVDQSAWIESEMQRLQKTSVSFSQRILTNGTPIPYMGGHVTLCVLTAGSQEPHVILSNKAFICYTTSTAQKEIRLLIEQWFRQKTYALVNERIDRLAVGVTSKPYRISVRGQKSRWGSCSSNGSLCFNWKLAMMPDYVIDYLIVHELAHLEEFNHSHRFWKIVKDKFKGVSRAKIWLKKNGPELE